MTKKNPKKAKMGHDASRVKTKERLVYSNLYTVKPSYNQLSGLARGFSVFDQDNNEVATGLGLWEAIKMAQKGS